MTVLEPFQFVLNNSLQLNLSKKPRTLIQKFFMFKQFQDFDRQSVKFGLTTMLANGGITVNWIF